MIEQNHTNTIIQENYNNLNQFSLSNNNSCLLNVHKSDLAYQSFKIYIDCKKDLYTSILNFLSLSDESDDTNEEKFQKLTEIMEIQQITKSKEETIQFLQILKNISDNHHRDPNFINNIYKILQHYKDKIKQTLSNIEIFHIFESNKNILLYLFQNEIITISETIYIEMINKLEANGIRYCYFFYPEIEKFIGKNDMKNIKKELLLNYPNAFENFDEKRFEGENDSYICSLIRQDSIKEFIVYVNQNNYSLSSTITPSIFETNSFLIENNDITLIEYSAFFGSIQVFQYLLMNNVKITPSLWLYAIHSKNPEMIHLLESIDICSNNNDFLDCFIESIKCHHNDIAEYFEYNKLVLKENDSQQKEEIVSNYIKHFNYAYFQIDSICEYGFFYLCYYNYNKLVDYFIQMKENEIKTKII